MGRCDPRYSDAQRQAIAEAINQEGASAPEVSRRASAGELADLPSFDLPESTARDIAAKERMGASQLDRNAVRDRSWLLLDEAVSLLERELADIGERQGQGELSMADLTRLEKIPRAACQLVKMEDALSGRPHPRAANGEASGTDPTTSLIEKMARDIDTQASANGG